MPDIRTDLLPLIDIRNFSGEIASILREELKKVATSGDERSIELKNIMSDTVSRKKYLLQYQELLKTAYSSALPREFILQLDKDNIEADAYINDAIRDFKVSTGGKYVDELLHPVFSAGITAFTDDAIGEHLQQNKEALNRLVNTGLSFLSAQGTRIMEAGEAIITSKFTKLKEKLTHNSLNELLLDKVINQANDLIKNHQGDIVITAEQALDQKFTEGFAVLRTGAEEAAKSSFKALGEGIELLTQNELAVHDVLNRFNEEISARSSQIAAIESKIGDLLKAPTPDLEELAKSQIAHASLVAENLFHNNIISQYLKDGIKIIDSIDTYKDKATKLFSGQYLNDFKSKLDALKKPTFSGVVSFASETLNTIDQISGTMEQLGIFKGAAKSVGKFVNYAKVAIGIATALLPPNPLGIIGALGSLGGLFGGGGPTVEEQMFDAMQEGFTHLNERLDQIETKINNLTELVQTVYKNLMQSIRIISSQLDLIREQVELSNTMLSFIIYKDYNLVETVIEGKEDITGSSGLELYSRWFNARTLIIIALSELGKLIESSVNLRSVIRQDFLIPGGTIGDLGKIELVAYNNSVKLTKKLFPDIQSSDNIKNLLLIPPQNNQFFTFQQGSSLMQGPSSYNFDAATENYYNPYFLTKLVDQYITLHPFFIITKNSQFEPFSDVQELLVKQNQQMIKDKLGPSKGRLNNLLDAINFSIIQQSILAGSLLMPFINNSLFGSDSPDYETVAEALKSNELMAKNAAVYFIHTKIDSERFKVFAELYYEIKSDPSKLHLLNELLTHGLGRLAFGMNNQNPANPVLCLYYTKPGGAEKLELPVPDFTIIEEQQMIYSNTMFLLLSAKEKVMKVLIDIAFFKSLPETSSPLYKEIFFSTSLI